MASSIPFGELRELFSKTNAAPENGVRIPTRTSEHFLAIVSKHLPELLDLAERCENAEAEANLCRPYRVLFKSQCERADRAESELAKMKAKENA